MENIVLVVHLILAICLIAVVLLQRSEGGGMGLGGGGSSGGLMTGRQAATALSKLTWAFAAAFLATSITLTILAAQNSEITSVLDRIGASAPAPSTTDGTSETAPTADSLLPPAVGDAPALPPRAE